ncbi:DEAD/DEAH box helicase [Ketogulonicigenium vulgare]|uniref:DEAD/DEAH box helicase n=1 Tax=Ketogulonicigenium vulgare TaxID=92945 RepID=UPI002358FC76|nr:ATP-binding domain-containing protein [Ketogulonicigenium vulgare]
MSNSFFFQQVGLNDSNEDLLREIKIWSKDTSTQTYAINKPLGDDRYDYGDVDFFVLLIPGRKIAFINYSAGDEFEEVVGDFIDDLGTISDKYRYKEAIGRPRTWRKRLVEVYEDGKSLTLNTILDETCLPDQGDRRLAELLVSLLIGSINDINRVRVEAPETPLDMVKRKITLFDADQSRFIYQTTDKDVVHIQGLSGTGKTELLLHKLKDTYISNSDSKIVFTCHNKILADSLRRRIPDFFNFMKVEKQIAWNENLWCMHAWGSAGERDSGTYAYICDFYNIPFERYGRSTPFNVVCKNALSAISAMKNVPPAFDFIFIDESQDFPKEFIDLCAAVSRSQMFVAGDIFQSIFDDSIISSISPDFLLSKCYRTDPKTLMFAHSLGMGLFEKQKLRWLEDEEWETCGYEVITSTNNDFYRLKREPLRRFEDVEGTAADGVSIRAVEGDFLINASSSVILAIEEILKENRTATVNDIGVIVADSGNKAFELADMVEQLVERKFKWKVNKAYQTKERMTDRLFLSNRNNVKGLEFPFVICITEKITSSYSYRNAIYMMLTRSFLKSYLILPQEKNMEILPKLLDGLAVINSKGFIEVQPPTEEEKEKIKTTIKNTNAYLSFHDFAMKIFDDIGVEQSSRRRLLKIVSDIVGEEFDEVKVRRVAQFSYDEISGLIE